MGKLVGWDGGKAPPILNGKRPPAIGRIANTACFFPSEAGDGQGLLVSMSPLLPPPPSLPHLVALPRVALAPYPPLRKHFFGFKTHFEAKQHWHRLSILSPLKVSAVNALRHKSTFLFLSVLFALKMKQISFDDFLSVELRVGEIISAEEFPEARRPAYKLTVDFGTEIGTRRSSAQITDHYKPSDLVGKQVVAVVNFPPKQIGPMISECLVTGFHDENGSVLLCTPDKQVPLGTRLL